MEPVILHLFFIDLKYHGVSNGLVSSPSFRVTSPSSISMSLSSISGGNFLLFVIPLRVGLLAFACAAACAFATLRALKASMRIWAYRKFITLIYSYSYNKYLCINHLYYFSRPCICRESRSAVTLFTIPSHNLYSDGSLRSSCHMCIFFSSR
jgi:hypothetical protein